MSQRDRLKTIVLLTTNSEQLPLNLHVKREIEKEFADIICLVVTRFDPQGEDGALYLHRGSEPSKLPAQALARKIREEYDLEPALLYRSDLRYARHTANEPQLLAETESTLARARDLIQSHNPSHVFMYGGGSLFTNCFFELVSRFEEVRCFRIHPLHYMNTTPNTLRYFFCSNNLQRLPQRTNEYRDIGRFEKCLEHARTYVHSVKTQRLVPDREARLISQKGAFASGLHRTAVDAAAWLVGRLLSRNTTLRRERTLSYVRKKYLDVTRRKYDFTGDYFIYVLHHPYDSQLLLRGRQFVDQMALCRILASNLPTGCRLMVKEHPVQPGMMPIGDIRRMVTLYPNTSYADYTVRFSEIVDSARGVITINSTAGLEAMIHGVPIVMLGEGFYRDEPFVRRVEYLAELSDTLKDVLLQPMIPTEDEVVDLIARLIYETEPEPDIEGADRLAYVLSGIKRRVAESDPARRR